MQPVVPALLFVGAEIGDGLPFRRPDHLIAPFLHFFDVLLLAADPFHRAVDLTHELDLPTLTLHRRPVFPRGKIRAALLIRLQNFITVRRTDLVAELPQLFKRIGILSELLSSLKAHGVDDEMGVGIICIAVRADEHLISRPCLLRELYGEIMGV